MSSSENTATTISKLAKKPRGPGFSIKEDKQLSASFLEKSVDPIVGRDKKLIIHWEQVTEHFNSERQSTVEDANKKLKKKEKFFERSRKSLVARWNIIHPKVSKFCSYYEREVRCRKSGLNDPDSLIDNALKMYLDLEGEEFELIECWKVLRKCPKWELHCEEEKQKEEAKKRKKGNEDRSDDEDDEGAQGIKRPMGNKQAKDKLSQARIIEMNRRADLELQKQHADLAAKRYELLKQANEREAKRDAMMREANDREIMSKDLTNMSLIQRKYFEILQNEIFERKMAEMRAKTVVVQVEGLGSDDVYGEEECEGEEGGESQEEDEAYDDESDD